jgi:hypothetical protein
MPRRPRLEETFESLRRLRDDPSAEASLRELKRVVAREGCHAVAKAATLIGEFDLPLAGELAAAFDRFMADPTRTDKGCVAKTAIAEALVRLQHAEEDMFLQGVRHVQMEPVFGGRVDTAIGLRSASALGLSQTSYPRTLVELAHLLADPEPRVRGAAARAVAAHGRAAGVPLLHLKAVAGDPEPQVTSDCLAALLMLDASGSLSFVVHFLDSRDPALAEAAALALGESRLAEAFEALRDRYTRGLSRDLGRTVLLAIGMLRRDEAVEFLISLVQKGATESARDALTALRVYRDNPAIRERIVRAAAARPELTEWLSRSIGVERGPAETA